MEILHDLPPYLIGWTIGLLAGGGAAIFLLRRLRLDTLQVLGTLVLLVLSIIAGAKVLGLIEIWFEAPERFFTLSVLRSPRMRIPGGFLLAILTGPLTARAMGVPFRRLADSIVPAAGLAIAGIRVGCFVQGCCFGAPSSLPWAVSYPPNTPPFWWQLEQGLIDPHASSSLPVQPLQLYFALTGIVLFVVLLWAQKRCRYDGQVLFLFVFLYSWSTWALELLRASPHETTRSVVLVVAVGATAVAVVAKWRRRVAMLPSRALEQNRA